MSRRGIRWTTDTITPTLAQFTVKANFAAQEAARELAIDIKRHMQIHAPWQDRTGAAREGLDTEVDHRGFRIDIYLFHSVDYGVWLEIRWNGAYAIIVPTLEHFQNVTWAYFDELLLASTLGRLR